MARRWRRNPAPQDRMRVPLWIAALLLFVAIWMSMHILQNVTNALTALTAGHHGTSMPTAWPTRWVRDAATP